MRNVGEVFKSTPRGDLTIEIFYPDGWSESDARTGIVIIPGGGWRRKCYASHVPISRQFADSGYVAFLSDYRHSYSDLCIDSGGLPDVGAAMRWVRGNAATLGVRPDKIVGFGASAGAQLMACTGILAGYDHPDDDMSVSKVPNLLLLNVPALEVNSGYTGSNYGDHFCDPDAMTARLHTHADAPPALLMSAAKGDRLAHGNAGFIEAATRLGVEAVYRTFDLDGGHTFWSKDNEANGGEGYRRMMQSCFDWMAAHDCEPITAPLPAFRKPARSGKRSALHARIRMAALDRLEKAPAGKRSFDTAGRSATLESGRRGRRAAGVRFAPSACEPTR